VPPALGFGDVAVGAPYAVVPPGSTLSYEIELLRISSRGPDALTDGIPKCGLDPAACADIAPAEFF